MLRAAYCGAQSGGGSGIQMCVGTWIEPHNRAGQKASSERQAPHIGKIMSHVLGFSGGGPWTQEE